MSIRLRLYLSYLAMAFVPFILLVLLALMILHYSGVKDIRELENVQVEERFNQASVYGEFSYIIRNEPGKLEDSSYVESMQNRLSEQWAGLILEKNDEVVEVSPFLTELAPDEDWGAIADRYPSEHHFKLYPFSSNGIEFQYPDGSPGKAVLLHRTAPYPLFWHPLSLSIMLVFIALTGLMLTYFVSRSIIKPLQLLRKAALRIKEGELDQSLDIRGVCGKGSGTEIAQVGSAFEDMRVRLKESIDQSLQYEENRKLLLSHISHDLKTPISAIKGYVEGIMDGIASTDEMKQRYIATIYRKASDMDQLIDELFLFSKLDLHKVAYDFKIVDMRRFVEDFMDEQRFELEKDGVALHCTSVSEEALPVAADPDKLNRVFVNIIGNSVKYMAHQQAGDKVISVAIKDNGDEVWIVLEDTGPGIDAEDLPYIFDRFYRAEQSRNSETGGSGLGLAIVKQMIEGHGGSVQAESGAGGGAAITLKLPKFRESKAVTEHEGDSDNRG
ncbi:sensor histidine kinase [Paenibacillus sp. CAU 1782]